MTPPIEQRAADSDLTFRPYRQQAVDAHPMNVDVHSEESPEMLRWRAELLLDEMMLGAVDAAAGEARSPFTSRVGSSQAETASPLSGDDQQSHGFSTDDLSRPQQRTSVAPSFPSSHLTTHDGVDGKATAHMNAQSRVVSVEQRYAQYSHTATFPPNGGNGATGIHASPAEFPSPGLGPVRRSVGATLAASDSAGVMSVTNRNVKYNNLLPRNTTWDARELQREIVALHQEIDRFLPPNHETSQRAHHLLDKANGILASDTLRSAEVDYYLAQVRAIVQRVSQHVEWSTQYRQRLTLYLSAWIVLSGVVIAGCILYGETIAGALRTLFGWEAGGNTDLIMVSLLLTLFAGALGGAAGALLTMQRVLRRAFGFIDRKYSLRGLVLPLLGVIAGLVIFIFLNLVYWALNLIVEQSLWLLLAPALAALVFGFFQESIYGARE